MSASFLVPGILSKRRILRTCCSCIYRAAMSMCRTLESPFLSTIDLTAVASTCSGTLASIIKPPMRICKPRASQEALMIPNNSLPADDVATVYCVFVQALRQCLPCTAVPPLVDLRLLPN